MAKAYGKGYTASPKRCTKTVPTSTAHTRLAQGERASLAGEREREPYHGGGMHLRLIEHVLQLHLLLPCRLRHACFNCAWV